MPGLRPQRQRHSVRTPSPFFPQSPLARLEENGMAANHSLAADDGDPATVQQELRLQRLEKQNTELMHLVQSIRRDMDELLRRVAPLSLTKARSHPPAPMSAAVGGDTLGHFG